MDIHHNEVAVWTELFKVRTFETDITGHLRMAHLCNYLQEVAGNHAHALGVSIEQLKPANITWMLSRIHVQVERYPAWGETVRVETWPSGHNGLQASREFLVHSEKGEHIAQGTSGWLMIDLNRHRPIRMPEFVDALVLPDLPRPIQDNFDKLPAPPKDPDGLVFPVLYSDLDINQHANNVSYISWALEAVPYDFRTSRNLQALEIQFRAEAKYGDKIVSCTARDEDHTIHHGLYNRTTDRELAIVRSRWE